MEEAIARLTAAVQALEDRDAKTQALLASLGDEKNKKEKEALANEILADHNTAVAHAVTLINGVAESLERLMA